MTVQCLAPDATRSERVPQINLEAEAIRLGLLPCTDRGRA
jgi:hypothetical protein